MQAFAAPFKPFDVVQRCKPSLHLNLSPTSCSFTSKARKMSVSSFTSPDAARIATALGLFSSGLLSGSTLALSAFAAPALLAASHTAPTHTPNTLVAALFTRLHARAHALAPPLALLSSSLLLYTSVVHYANDSRRWAVYAVAGALAASGAVGGKGRATGVARLARTAGQDRVSGVGKEAEGGEEALLDVDGQVAAVVQWTRANWARGAAQALGFALALAAAFSTYK
ncbi:hypothetical protein FA95DRAFT_1683012 [Auriscalpium vulgare]|uniref:Uncharacterized protein n=1 Tax=Auriscalpium vulgare TaxID=40419 RepID=A0ACB8RD03_9AGAM|nr:hypothetical protein FA95DRAFT_1683012 [Auriscalpium vulgare]